MSAYRPGRLLTVLLAVALVATGCGHGRADYIAQLQSSDPGALESDDPGSSADPGESAPAVLPPDPAQIGVQLDSFFGPEAAGIYDALVNGLYEAEAIEVGVMPGSPDQDPVDAVMAPDGPQVLIATLPYVLQARETKRADLVLVAQLFKRSGTLLVSPKTAAVTTLQRLKGKLVGVMDMAGRALDVQAAIAAAGLKATDYQTTGGYDFVGDPSSIPSTTTLRSGAVAALQATSYDIYPQLLEFPSDDGSPAYTPAQLAVSDLDATGAAMASLGVYARASWLADPKNRNAMVRFLRATFAGYSDCADSVADCAQLVSDQGNPMPDGHLQYAVNTVNQLMWPNPDGIGSMPAGLYEATVQRLLAAGLLKAAPDPAAVDLSLADDARAAAKDGVDLRWAAYTPAVTPIFPGGTDPTAVESPDPNASDEPVPDGTPAP